MQNKILHFYSLFIDFWFHQPTIEKKKTLWWEKKKKSLLYKIMVKIAQITMSMNGSYQKKLKIQKIVCISLFVWGKRLEIIFNANLVQIYKVFLCSKKQGGIIWEHFLDNIPLVPMGFLAPRSAHAWPFAQPPIDTREICWRMCLVGGRGNKYWTLFWSIF